MTSPQHASIRSLMLAERESDPAVAIRTRARSLVNEVRENIGWDGPPFDPQHLASYRGLKVRRVFEGLSSKQDACVTTGLIAVNARKPRQRQRYSVAHEVVHTLFPDYQEILAKKKRLLRSEEDESELERLCQIGASELLLPEFAFKPRLESQGLSLSTILKLRSEFDASPEATARRAIDLWEEPALLVFFRPRANGDLGHAISFRPTRYSPSAPLYSSLICRNAAAKPVNIRIGVLPPNRSVVMKAWKRAGTRGLAADVYVAEEQWPELELSGLHCEAMVLPVRSLKPLEVLALLTLSPTAAAA